MSFIDKLACHEATGRIVLFRPNPSHEFLMRRIVLPTICLILSAVFASPCTQENRRRGE